LLSALTALCLVFSVQARADMVYTVQPSLTVSQEYTDNLFQTDDEEESEWITVVSPRLDLSLIGKDLQVELGYAPGFSFYNDNSEFDSVRHSGNLSIRKDLSRHLRLTVTDVLTRTEEPYTRGELTLREGETLEEMIDYTVRQSREPRLTNTARTRLEYEFGPKSRAYAGYSYGIVEDDNPEESDSTRHVPQAGVTYWFGNHYGVDLSGSYTRADFSSDNELFEPDDDFDQWDGSLRLLRNFTRHLDGFVRYSHTAIDYEGDREDYQVYRPSIGIDYRFAERGSGSVGVSYYYQDYGDGPEARDDESGFLLDADVNYSWAKPRWNLTLTGSSGYEETRFGSENLGFTIYYGAGAAYSYSLTRRATAELNLNYRFNRYTDEDPEREDHVASVRGGLNYQVLRWLFVNLSDTFRMVESNIDEEQYTENSVVLSLTFQPQPFRF